MEREPHEPLRLLKGKDEANHVSSAARISRTTIPTETETIQGIAFRTARDTPKTDIVRDRLRARSRTAKACQSSKRTTDRQRCVVSCRPLQNCHCPRAPLPKRGRTWPEKQHCNNRRLSSTIQRMGPIQQKPRFTRCDMSGTKSQQVT